jgi:hypothetical protein
MPNPMTRIHDLATDTVVDREMTDEEYAQYLESTTPQSVE